MDQAWQVFKNTQGSEKYFEIFFKVGCGKLNVTKMILWDLSWSCLTTTEVK